MPVTFIALYHFAIAMSKPLRHKVRVAFRVEQILGTGMAQGVRTDLFQIRRTRILFDQTLNGTRGKGLALLADKQRRIFPVGGTGRQISPQDMSECFVNRHLMRMTGRSDIQTQALIRHRKAVRMQLCNFIYAQTGL